jgi:hypothetical protein
VKFHKQLSVSWNWRSGKSKSEKNSLFFPTWRLDLPLATTLKINIWCSGIRPYTERPWSISVKRFAWVRRSKAQKKFGHWSLGEEGGEWESSAEQQQGSTVEAKTTSASKAYLWKLKGVGSSECWRDGTGVLSSLCWQTGLIVSSRGRFWFPNPLFDLLHHCITVYYYRPLLLDNHYHDFGCFRSKRLLVGDWMDNLGLIHCYLR